MEKWEYKTIVVKLSFNISDFNEFGKEGWELVSIIEIHNTGTYKVFFKRKI